MNSPARKQRRGKGTSDPIDAHLAVLAALRLDADRLPAPRADGDRKALRILLGARQEITAVSTGQTNRLRALLAGDDADRQTARSALTATTLAYLGCRELSVAAGRDQAVRHAEIQRLALALQQARRQLNANRRQLLAIVADIAPGLTDRYGVGPVTAAQAVVSLSHRAAAAAKQHSRPWAAPIPSRPAAAGWCGIGSTAAVTEP